ncbi:tenascin X [Tieghemostelium lacteum]|uniref:Tenascin X n=1 Tax=Tieghemostelium lacteum TaxID=361077 RepID=A0A151ZJX2_TIELA|nr:tenascin X [Tieghemostelium lacteum]|eukprot:KYQ94114.1 tenascin X [Tieghemostelium lacteum]
MYIFILLILILKISINFALPSSESLLNDSNSYGLDIGSEYKTGGFDFNGDGKQDFITSHHQTNKTYVFFGDISRYSGQRPLKVSMIDGINGFSIEIKQMDLRNYFICGDINNDGYDEIIIRVSNGQLKIIYGHSGPFKNVFSTFDGIEGFVIDSIYSPGMTYDTYQVICDHNGDGINDLIFNILGNVFILYGLDNGKKFPTESGKFNINFLSNGTLGHVIFKNSINLGCGDLNNDGIDDLVILSDTGNGTVSFGLKFYPTQYNPVLNGSTGFTLDIQGIDFVLQIGFGDFNGDGLQDMAVASQDSKSIYMIYGKKGGIWEPHFDINSGNSSEVVKWVRNENTPEELCFSLYVGDINGDGISDLSCDVYSLGYTWGVYGTTMKLPAVYDLNITTSPLFGDCRGFIIFNTQLTFSSWTDFNNDGIQDLIIYFSNSQNYIIFGEKTIFSASLNIINTSIHYNSFGEFHFLESNFNPNSSGNCNVQFITFKVLDGNVSSDYLTFSRNRSSNGMKKGDLFHVYNEHNDPNFLQSLSNVLYVTNRNSSIVTISIQYLNIINDTIKIFINTNITGTATTGTPPVSLIATTSTSPTTSTQLVTATTTATTTTGTTTGTATTGTATTGTATTGTATTGTATTGTATTGTATTGTATGTATTTGVQPLVTATVTGTQPLITSTVSTSTPVTATTSPYTQQNKTVNNDCTCIRGQICLSNSHICVNQFDVYQGESCFQLSCALGYDCKEQSNQIYKCVKQYSCNTCADITCKSPHRCILVLTTSKKCKYQPTCSN